MRENLKRIKMPPGFKIDLYAVVPDARSIGVAPSTHMMFVGTRKTNVWAVTNRNSGDTATEVREFAPSLKFRNPNAVCLVAQLKAYRGGTRRHEAMSLMAKRLSDTEIDDLAAWYASLKVTVQPVP